MLRRLCLFVAIVLALQSNAKAAIPFRFANGLILIDVKVASSTQPLTFVVDTGSEVTLLHSKTAAALGLKKSAHERIRGVHTAVTGCWIKNFNALAGGERLPQRVLSLDLNRLTSLRIDGLIGADFFHDRVVRIDYKARTLEILQSSRLSGADVVPMHTRAGVFCVKASVDGAKPRWVRVDTGCVDAMHWAGDTSSRSTHQLTSALVHSELRSQKTQVMIGGTVLRDVRTTFHRNAIFPGEAGLLGNGLLSRFTITIDGPENRLLLN
jgi:predicted aspartyl protease